MQTVCEDSNMLHQNDESCCYAVSSFSYRGTCEHQEDRLLYRIGDVDAVLAVCDGMGGMQNGAQAAQAAIDAIRDLAAAGSWQDAPIPFLKQCITAGDEAVCSLTDSQGNKVKSGCTVALAVMVGKYLYCANVGDSRVYLYRKGKIAQLTVDHNYDRLLREKLEDHRISQEEYEKEQKKAAALTSYLGLGNLQEIFICQEPLTLERDDIVFLQSDGVYKSLHWESMIELLSQNERDPDRAGQTILETIIGMQLRYQDNTSFILARMK